MLASSVLMYVAHPMTRWPHILHQRGSAHTSWYAPDQSKGYSKYCLLYVDPTCKRWTVLGRLRCNYSCAKTLKICKTICVTWRRGRARSKRKMTVSGDRNPFLRRLFCCRHLEYKTTCMHASVLVGHTGNLSSWFLPSSFKSLGFYVVILSTENAVLMIASELGNPV